MATIEEDRYVTKTKQLKAETKRLEAETAKLRALTRLLNAQAANQEKEL